MKKTKFFSLLLSSVLTISLIGNLTACKNNEDDDESNSWNNVSKLKYFGIENAKNLYISTGSSSTRSARDGSDGVKKLFKITEDGYTEEVKYLDENGKEISVTQQPETIYPINDEYIFVGFGYSSSYLVRKTDGAAYIVPSEIGMPEKNMFDFLNSNPIRFDNKNCMYYLYNHQIHKIDLSGIEALKSSVVSASTDYVYHFEVDKDGNIVYSGASNPSTYSPINRVKKSNGGLVNISYMGGNWCFDGWLSPDGYIYCIKRNDETNDYVINKMNIDEKLEFSEIEYGHIDSSPYCVTTEYLVNLEKNGIIVDTNPCRIFEVYNETNNPRVVSLVNLEFNTISSVISTENFYYIAGTDSKNNTFLIKVDPTTDEYTNLLPQNDYDVFSFTASESDGIVFNALRMNDGKKIIGKVGINGGNVAIIDEESDVEISYLKRIN